MRMDYWAGKEREKEKEKEKERKWRNKSIHHGQTSTHAVDVKREERKIAHIGEEKVRK